MANFWMHNGFLQVEGEKMSKSLGNFVTIRELLEDWHGYSWPGEALRFNMLRTHYRQPLDWTLQGLDESHKILWDWYGLLDGHSVEASVPQELARALMDDLNTPQAIAELHKFRKDRNYEKLAASLLHLGFSCDRDNIQLVRHVGARDELPVALDENSTFHRTISTGDKFSKELVDALVNARNAARTSKNYILADNIRDELAAMGVVLHDTKDGTTWEIAR
jgi:cysteinyl-tRNA synthetase